MQRYFDVSEPRPPPEAKDIRLHSKESPVERG